MAARAKKTSTRKTGKSQPRETKETRGAKKQMWAVLLFAVGLFLLALTFIEGSMLWLWLHRTLFGLFGIGTYFIAALTLYTAVIVAMDRPMSSIKAKIWQLALLIVMISGTVQTFTGLPSEENFVENVIALWNQGVNITGGGIAGAVFALPLSLFGTPGDKIIVVLLLFVLVMLVTGSSLISLLRAAKKPVKGIEEAYAARVEDRQQKSAGKAGKKPRFDIDVDISGDKPLEELEPLPEHPVAASAMDAKNAKSKLIDLAVQDKPVEYISLEEFGSAAPQPDDAEPARAHPLDDEIEGPTEIDEIIDRFVGGQPPALTPPGKPDPTPEVIPAMPPPEPPTPPEPPVYYFPPVNLLGQVAGPVSGDISEELKQNAQTLVDTLKSFGVQTRITDICRGPSVTRYELQPSAGVKISKITGLADDIALNLASAGIRIEAPIPNKPAVGIEVPNKQISTVSIRELIESPEFQSANGVLNTALGRDIAGNITLADIGRMPHVLIAGATGSGKSVCINSIVISLLYKYPPDEVKLLMVDPKVVELGVYNGIPHLLQPVVTDPKKAAGALGWAVSEMMNRYKLFAANAVKDLAGYNRLAATKEDLPKMPKIVIIIDELADLMMAAPNEVEDCICRLAQMARAAGMHLVIATQRPSVDVITGVIKANIPSRIAFAVSSQVDSRTILDMGGAEKLLGRGDMLFYPVGVAKPLRVQGCFITEDEVEQVVRHITPREGVIYDEAITKEIERHAVTGKNGAKGSADDGEDEFDEMLEPAIECVVEAGQASTSQLQRRLKLGYARAARIIDQLEQKGIVGPFEGSKPRQVLISKDRWIEMKLAGALDAANTPAPEGVPDEIGSIPFDL